MIVKQLGVVCKACFPFLSYRSVFHCFVLNYMDIVEYATFHCDTVKVENGLQTTSLSNVKLEKFVTSSCFMIIYILKYKHLSSKDQVFFTLRFHLCLLTSVNSLVCVKRNDNCSIVSAVSCFLLLLFE